MENIKGMNMNHIFKKVCIAILVLLVILFFGLSIFEILI